MHSNLALCVTAAALFAGAFPAATLGQQPPELGYVFPPGGRAGTTVEVRLGGYDFTPDTQFFVLDERVELEVLGPPSEMLFLPPPYWFGPKASNKAFSVPREVPARLVLPEDLPAGVLHWQAANANGSTARGEFVVSRGPKEVLEDEQEVDRRLQPQPLPPLPLTVSGSLKKKEEIDRYRFTVERAGLVTCRLPAHRVGYPIHALLAVFDSTGRSVAEAADTEGTGLILTFAAKAGETYTLKLHDIDFRGDRSMVYRLTIEQAPSVLAAIPAAGRRGTTRRVTFFGYGLATGQPQLESTVCAVAFPDAPEHESFTYSLDTPFGAASFDLGLSDVEEQVESEVKGDELSHQPLDVPSAVTGVLDDPFRGDDYRLHAAKGERYWIAVDAQRIGSPLDVSLMVLDADGKTVAESDDLAGTTDAELAFDAPADGDYRITVSDLSGRAGKSTSVYRLSVQQPAAGFTISVPEQVNSIVGAEPVEVSGKKRRRGNQAGVLTVQATRQGGFQGAISVQLEGLPPGIATAEKIEIPEKQTEVSIPIPCDAKAASFASLVTVQANAELEDGSRVEDQAVVLVAPVIPPRAVVRPYYPDAGRTVHRGATYLAPVVLERLEGYEGEVRLQLAARPDRVRQGISGREMNVAAELEQVEFPIFLPEWVQTDRTSRIVLNTVVQVPDGEGNVRHLVNRMDRRITMNVEGALLKLTAAEREFSAQQGQAIDVPLKLFRSPKLDGPVELSLPKTQPRNGLFLADPIVLPAEQTEAVLRITTSSSEWAAGEYEVTIQATASQGDPEAIVRSRTSVFIIKVDG